MKAIHAYILLTALILCFFFPHKVYAGYTSAALTKTNSFNVQHTSQIELSDSKVVEFTNVQFTRTVTQMPYGFDYNNPQARAYGWIMYQTVCTYDTGLKQYSNVAITKFPSLTVSGYNGDGANIDISISDGVIKVIFGGVYYANEPCVFSFILYNDDCPDILQVNPDNYQTVNNIHSGLAPYYGLTSAFTLYASKQTVTETGYDGAGINGKTYLFTWPNVSGETNGGFYIDYYKDSGYLYVSPTTYDLCLSNWNPKLYCVIYKNAINGNELSTFMHNNY